MPLRENKTPCASSLFFQIASPRCTHLCNSAFARPPNRLTVILMSALMEPYLRYRLIGSTSEVSSVRGFIMVNVVFMVRSGSFLHNVYFTMGLFGRPLFTYLLRTLTEGDKRWDLRCAYVGSRSDALTSCAYFLHFHFVTSSTWHAVNGSFKVLSAIKNHTLSTVWYAMVSHFSCRCAPRVVFCVVVACATSACAVLDAWP